MPSSLLQIAADDAAFHVKRAERAIEKGDLESFYHHARMAHAANTTCNTLLAPLRDAKTLRPTIPVVPETPEEPRTNGSNNH